MSSCFSLVMKVPILQGTSCLHLQFKVTKQGYDSDICISSSKDGIPIIEYVAYCHYLNIIQFNLVFT